MPKMKQRIGESAMQRDIRCGYAYVGFDAQAAQHDPLFWISLAIAGLTFGVIDLGRWRRYITVRHVLVA